MTINDALQSLVADLAAEGIADPLAEPLTLAAVWHDLCHLTGEPLPSEVAALLDGPRPIRPVSPPRNRRGRCARCGRASPAASRSEWMATAMPRRASRSAPVAPRPTRSMLGAC